jgi:serine/threonine-protein kinase
MEGMPPPGRPGEELIGTEVSGKYRILKLLGEGAMGAVYLGEHTRIGRKDAIKILRKGLTTDAESIARFNRGARNMSAIRHPNVCTLYDYGETVDGSPFLALELIEGESLKELVEREKALDPRRAIHIALQTAQALDAAHHAGIVHRDLKPANIMLETGRDGSDIVKVVDFDIAKGPEPEGGEEVTRLGYVVGTPEYMSPEQLTGEKLDGRSDIYSLGVTFYRMLTGVLTPCRFNRTHRMGAGAGQAGRAQCRFRPSPD